MPEGNDTVRPTGFLGLAEQHFDAALSSGFELFSGDIAKSSPLNGPPYMVGKERLVECLSSWPGRTKLFASLDRMLARLVELGISCHALLLGGSILDRNNPGPKDLDGLLFYSAPNGLEPEQANEVTTLTRAGKTQGLDLRMVPLDGDPLIAIKIACYFNNLYSMNHTGGRNNRSTVLVSLAPPA